MAKFSGGISNIIEGKIGNQNYQFKMYSDLQSMDFVEAMQRRKKVFKSKFLNKETVAISVWTTPKRTKTYPLARVYTTLSYGGTKITIIPVMVNYGKHGEPGKIQPNTVDWMTSVGVYLILGVYIDAKKAKVGRLAKKSPNRSSNIRRLTRQLPPGPSEPHSRTFSRAEL